MTYNLPNLDEVTTLLSTWESDTEFYPFIANEDGNVTGPGHMNPEAFALLVYSCIGSHVDPADVMHKYILLKPVPDTGEYDLEVASPNTPGSIPVTTIWGVL